MNRTVRISLSVLIITTAFAAFLSCGGGGSSSSGPVDPGVRVDAGTAHAVLLGDDGTVWCWGENAYGEAGTDSSNIPVTTTLQLGTDDQWEQVAAGGVHSMGIKVDGTLWGWGGSYNGAMGTTSSSNQYSEIQIGSDSDWELVSAGIDHTVAIKDDGTLWAWGQNGAGQVGTNSGVSEVSIPAQVGTCTSWSQVSAGNYFSAAVKDDGSLWAWGSNSYGQLGTDNGDASIYEPTQVESAVDWSFVSAGGSHVLALKDGGTLFAWGGNVYGQAGTDKTVQKIRAPRQLGTDTWKKVSAGGIHSLGVRSSGTLWGWGSNQQSQLGTVIVAPLDFEAPVQIGSDSDWFTVSAGEYYSTAVKNGGTVWAFGQNQEGQVGNGVSGDKFSHTQIGSASDWTFVAAGYYYSYAMTSAGVIMASGDNDYGQLGLWDISPRKQFTSTALSGWDRIQLGRYHTLGIKTNGTLWAWGLNGSGQLGTSTSQAQADPFMVSAETDWVEVAVGEGHSLAVKSDGSLWAWGNNFHGQLGTTNPPATMYEPTQVAVSGSWNSVFAAANHSLAIKDDGTLWGWGQNDASQLGTDSDESDIYAPVQIGADTWKMLSTSLWHTLGINSGDELWAWGSNMGFQLGTSQGGWTTFTTPVRIGSDTDWEWIGAGAGWSLGTKQTTDLLYMWGSTYSARLGPVTGPDTYNRTPTQWGSDQWQMIAAGRSHALGVKDDGSLWGWGYNYNGEIGDGSAWETDPWQVY